MTDYMGAARASYGERTYERLVALKNEYDPTNVFQLNQNIELETSGESSDPDESRLTIRVSHGCAIVRECHS